MRPLLKLWHDFIGHKKCYIDYEWCGDHGVVMVRCDECGMAKPVSKRLSRDLFNRLATAHQPEEGK